MMAKANYLLILPGVPLLVTACFRYHRVARASENSVQSLGFHSFPFSLPEPSISRFKLSVKPYLDVTQMSKSM